METIQFIHFFLFAYNLPLLFYFLFFQRIHLSFAIVQLIQSFNIVMNNLFSLEAFCVMHVYDNMICVYISFIFFQMSCLIIYRYTFLKNKYLKSSMSCAILHTNYFLVFLSMDTIVLVFLHLVSWCKSRAKATCLPSSCTLLYVVIQVGITTKLAPSYNTIWNLRFYMLHP